MRGRMARQPICASGKRGRNRMAGTKKKQNTVKVIILFVVLALLIGIYYFHLSNKERKADAEKDVESTVVQEVLMRDLEHHYPPTPKEVIKYYSEISQCFYNESYSEEELILLAEQAQRLYCLLYTSDAADEYLFV